MRLLRMVDFWVKSEIMMVERHHGESATRRERKCVRVVSRRRVVRRGPILNLGSPRRLSRFSTR